MAASSTPHSSSVEELTRLCCSSRLPPPPLMPAHAMSKSAPFTAGVLPLLQQALTTAATEGPRPSRTHGIKGMHRCHMCLLLQPRERFSSAQLKRRGKRLCRDCIDHILTDELGLGEDVCECELCGGASECDCFSSEDASSSDGSCSCSEEALERDGPELENLAAWVDESDLLYYSHEYSRARPSRKGHVPIYRPHKKARAATNVPSELTEQALLTAANTSHQKTHQEDEQKLPQEEEKKVISTAVQELKIDDDEKKRPSTEQPLRIRCTAIALPFIAQ